MVTSNKTALRVGRLVKAHGLKGAFKLELYTDSPEQRFAAGAVLDLQVPETSPWFGKKVEVAELRFYNSMPVLFLKDIVDRSTAETLVRAILLVNADLADLPEEEDAWFDHQLVGLKVLRDGIEVGQVIRVEHFPAQDLLVVKTATVDEVLVPFVKAIVPVVDMAAGTLVVTPPIGLFEEVLPELVATPAEGSAALAEESEAAELEDADSDLNPEYGEDE
jgi:16S rRNA processing protein RimM